MAQKSNSHYVPKWTAIDCFGVLVFSQPPGTRSVEGAQPLSRKEQIF